MTNVTPAFFVDTNVLVYAYDARDAAKRARAIAVIEALTNSRQGVISVQVLKEFCATVLRKHILEPDYAATVVRDFMDSWDVFEVTSREVLAALRGVTLHQLSYYDALIWESAREHGVPSILSEDGQHNRVVEGVRYLNPFADDFDMALLS